jgi:2-(1,2-epoxy-1,2-dihydrophenyl)acetyl-CoA isomerase
VVPGEELMATTMELAQRLAQAPTRAIGLTKRAMNRALSMDLEAALAHETDMQELAGRTHDHKEGVQAFIEKRAPQFRGE